MSLKVKASVASYRNTYYVVAQCARLRYSVLSNGEVNWHPLLMVGTGIGDEQGEQCNQDAHEAPEIDASVESWLSFCYSTCCYLTGRPHNLNPTGEQDRLDCQELRYVLGAFPSDSALFAC